MTAPAAVRTATTAGAMVVTRLLTRAAYGLLLLAEDLVDLAAGVVDDVEDALPLLLTAGIGATGRRRPSTA